MPGWTDYFKTPHPLKLYILHTGYIHMKGNIHFNRKHPKASMMPKDHRFNPVFAFLVQHPEKGLMLLDTGLHASFADRSFGNFGRFLGFMVKTKTEPGWDTFSQLRRLKFSPEGVENVILSHLHLDHPSGLPAFKNIKGLKVFVDREELKTAMGPFGLLKGYIKRHLRDVEIHPLQYPLSIPPFDNVWDFFDDGSVFVVKTPGHSPGHVSILLNAVGGPLLLTFDALHRQANLKEEIPPVGDLAAATNSIIKVKEFIGQYANTRIIYSHDPDQLDTLQLAPKYYA